MPKQTRCPYCSTLMILNDSFRIGGEVVCRHCRRTYVTLEAPKEPSTQTVDDYNSSSPSPEFIRNADKAKDETTGFTLAGGPEEPLTKPSAPVVPSAPAKPAVPTPPELKQEISDHFFGMNNPSRNAAGLKNPQKPMPAQNSPRKETNTPVSEKSAVRPSNGESTNLAKQEITASSPLTEYRANVPPLNETNKSVSASRIQTISRLIDSSRPAESSESVSKIWTVGQLLLGGKYEVVEIAPGVPYAEGGVGIVHRVHHREWDIDFTVKSPKPDVSLSESGKENFEQECQTWIELGLHTNIVTCYLVRRIGGMPRVFAEFVPDGTLREWILDGRLYEGGEDQALARILDIAIQFAWGLDHAHRQGLLHLDVKPGNVMMSGSTAKVTDFGLAKVVRSFEEDGDGPSASYCEGMTPSYCSPEQYDAFLLYQKDDKKKENDAASSDAPADKITRQSDIWSWAISILAMFHGRSPCKKGGQTAAEVFDVFLKIPPSGGRPAMPPGLVELMRRCFERVPANRPSSMGEVAARLIEIYQETVGIPYPRQEPKNTTFTAESFCNRAISMLDLGKPVEAYKLIERAASMSFWHPQITFNKTLMGWRYGLITDLQALHQMEELTKYNGRDPFSFYALGLLQKERANPKGALIALEKAQEIDPKRPEFDKAIQLCRSSAVREAGCCGRFVLHRPTGGESPVVYTDTSNNFCLMPIGDRNLTLLSIESGHSLFSFKQKEPQSSDDSLIALSDDYRRELHREQDGTILLKSADAPSVQGAPLPAAQERLVPIPWGRKQDAFDRARKIRLSIRENVVDVHHVASGKYILSFIGHEHDITSLYLSPDGKWAATGSFDNSLRIWRVTTGRCIRTFRGLSGAVDAVWMDERHRCILSTVNETSLQMWNIDLLCNRRDATRAPILICVVSSSEEVARRQSELDVQIRRAKESAAAGDYRTTVASLNSAKMIEGWQTVRTELNLPDLIGRHAEAIDIGDVVSGASFQGHDEPVSSVALSYDGRLALSAGKDQIIRLWQFPQTRCLQELSGHYDWIRSIDMTADGRFAVSGSWDRTVRIWNLQTGTQVRAMGEQIRNVSQVRIAPDNRSIIVATASGELSIWDGSSGLKIRSWEAHDGAIHAIRVSRDGRYLLSGGDDLSMILWDLSTAKAVRTFRGFKNPIMSVDLSADLRLAVGGDDGADILLYDLTAEPNKPPRVFRGHLGNITSVLLMPDNRRIVSASKDRTIRFWDIDSNELIKTLEGNVASINDIAVDIGQSALFAADENAGLRLWNIFWDYDYPGRRRERGELTRMLHVISGHFLRMADIMKNRHRPMEYYQKAPNAPKECASIAGLSLDEKTVLRILTEMEYRGFGNIPKEEIFLALKRLLENWNGLLEV